MKLFWHYLKMFMSALHVASWKSMHGWPKVTRSFGPWPLKSEDRESSTSGDRPPRSKPKGAEMSLGPPRFLLGISGFWWFLTYCWRKLDQLKLTPNSFTLFDLWRWGPYDALSYNFHDGLLFHVYYSLELPVRCVCVYFLVTLSAGLYHMLY